MKAEPTKPNKNADLSAEVKRTTAAQEIFKPFDGAEAGFDSRRFSNIGRAVNQSVNLSKHSLSVDRKSEDRKRSANLRLKPVESSQKQPDKKQASTKTTAKKKLKTL